MRVNRKGKYTIRLSFSRVSNSKWPVKIGLYPFELLYSLQNVIKIRINQKIKFVKPLSELVKISLFVVKIGALFLVTKKPFRVKISSFSSLQDKLLLGTKLKILNKKSNYFSSFFVGIVLQ